MRKALTSRVAPTPRPLLAASLLIAAACVAAPQEPDSTLLEAVDWYTGVAGEVDDVRARELLEEAVAGEGPLAVMWLARVHSTVDADPALAVQWWTSAAEEGDAITQLRLGEAYEAGRGVLRDLERARQWYERAATAGNAQARQALESLNAS